MQIDLNSKRCAKQITVAIIENRGQYWLGTNSCEKPQKNCPRGKMPSGVGYEYCQDVCKQTGHAEENAVKAAGKDAKGGTLFLIGHTYCCDNCREVMKKAGIRNVILAGDFWNTNKRRK